MRHIRPWVRQTIEAYEAQCKAFTTFIVNQCIATVDAHVDAFKELVQKSVAKAQTVDLSAFCEELIKFKANLITLLAAPIIVPEPTPIDEPLFDMFESEDSHTACFWKETH